MKHIGLYTTAALSLLLFSTTGAQISVLGVIQGLQSTPQSYPSPLYTFSLCMEITNRVFNDSLYNMNSPQYKQMYAEVSGVLDIAFNCSNCATRDTYRGVENMQFRRGSVIANCTIEFETIFINQVVIKYLFLGAIDKNNLTNGLAINRQYTGETVTPSWLFLKSTTPIATALPLTGSGYYWLPGWAIALLVLACIIILLLLILILLLCCWCCRRKDKKEETINITEHVPYQRTSFKEHLANPTYMSHTPEGSPNYPAFGEPDLQHGNRNGMYMMNPQR